MTPSINFEQILTGNKVIAVVGFSDNHTRPSNRIGRYLWGNLYKVFGVNPKLENKIIDDIKCFPSLKEIPVNIDIVNIFRRSEFVFDLVKEVLELENLPDVIWAQVGVISNEAKKLAESKGIVYIENKCIMVEHSKIF